MGEPAIPGPVERAASLDLARRTLDKVRLDEAVPNDLAALAALVVWQHEELEQMRDTAARAVIEIGRRGAPR